MAATGAAPTAGNLPAYPAERYAHFRPTFRYPRELYDAVLAFADGGACSSRACAVDVATGRTAEHTGLPDASADLLIAAEAPHWFAVPAFYAEAARVLKPSGTLAVWGYEYCAMDNAAAHALIEAVYRGADLYVPLPASTCV